MCGYFLASTRVRREEILCIHVLKLTAAFGILSTAVTPSVWLGVQSAKAMDENNRRAAVVPKWNVH